MAEAGLDFGCCPISLPCHTNGDGGQRGSEVVRIVRFPRLVLKA